MSLASSVVDVLILGGGPGGLSAALTLSRLLHTAVLFDSGSYRNSLAKHMHTVPSWDHAPPAEFRQATRDNILSRYNTTQFQDVKVERLTKVSSGPHTGLFEAADANGTTWLGRKVILATGVRDIFPTIPGYESCWATGIFHCLFCHGYEDRGVPSVGVLAVESMANASHPIMVSRMALRLTEKVTIYTNGNTDLAEQLQAATKKNIHMFLDSRVITKLEKGPSKADVVLHFSDGTSKVEGFLVHTPRSGTIGTFAEQLGLEVGPGGEFVTAGVFPEVVGKDTEGKPVHGVFTGGDAAAPMLKTATNAVVTGGFAAVGAIAQLEAEIEEEEFKEYEKTQKSA